MRGTADASTQKVINGKVNWSTTGGEVRKHLKEDLVTGLSAGIAPGASRAAGLEKTGLTAAQTIVRRTAVHGGVAATTNLVGTGVDTALGMAAGESWTEARDKRLVPGLKQTGAATVSAALTAPVGGVAHSLASRGRPVLGKLVEHGGEAVVAGGTALAMGGTLKGATQALVTSAVISKGQRGSQTARSPKTTATKREAPRARPRGHTAEGSGKDFTHGPLPELGDVPVTYGRGSGRGRGDVMTSYADATRSRAQKNRATAAAEAESGPYIRDKNLYSGAAETRVVANLQEQGVLDVPPSGGAVRVVDPDRYVRWVERGYRQHGDAHLDPEMRAAIRGYVSQKEPLDVLGTDPHTGGVSGGGLLPGTHAELLALNDVLVGGGGANPATVATVRAKSGAHFAACLHCAAIIDRLPASVRVLVHTGRATSTP